MRKGIVIVLALMVLLVGFFSLQEEFWLNLGITAFGGFLLGIATSPFQQKATSNCDDDEAEHLSPTDQEDDRGE